MKPTALFVVFFALNACGGAVDARYEPAPAAQPACEIGASDGGATDAHDAALDAVLEASPAHDADAASESDADANDSPSDSSDAREIAICDPSTCPDGEPCCDAGAD